MSMSALNHENTSITRFTLHAIELHAFLFIEYSGELEGPADYTQQQQNHFHDPTTFFLLILHFKNKG